MSILTRVMGGRRGWYTPFEPQQEPAPETTWWASEANVREPVQVYPHQSPEPGAQGGAFGEIPSRVAMVQVVTFHHNQQPMGAESFVAAWRDTFPGRDIQTPRGRQTGFGARANIPRPPAVAYGSLFSAASSYPYHG